MKQISANITGSIILNGVDVTETVGSSAAWSGSLASRVTSLEVFTGSVNTYTASVNDAITGLNTFTSSANSRIGTLENVTASYATTASNTFNGNQTVTGSLVVTGQVVAQTLNVQQVTSSVVYSSGSNVFGNSLANTHQFTGSLSVTGSLTSVGQLTVQQSGDTTISIRANSSANTARILFNNASTSAWALFKDSTTSDFRLYNYSGSAFAVTVNYSTNAVLFGGSVTAASIARTGGTSGQFLKADGSVDSTSYATAASLSGYMDLSTNQTAAGNKTFTGFIQLNGRQYIFLGDSGNTLFPYIRNTGGDGIGIYSNAGSALLTANTSTGISTNGRDFAAGIITGTMLNASTSSNVVGSVNSTNATGGYMTWSTNGVVIADLGTATQVFGSGGAEVFGINGRGARDIAFGTNNTERFRISSTGVSTFLGTLNGTSLSMSGGATIGARVQVLGNTAPASGTGLELFYDGSGAGTLAFARGTGYIPNFMDGSQLQFFTSSNERGRFASDGTFLINTTTTDGTNKLIVNGGVKGETITATNGFVSNRTADGLAGQFYRSTINGSTILNTGLILGKVNTANNAASIVYTHTADGSTNNQLGFGFWANDNLFTLKATGAATFSSLGTGTVYSNGGTLTNTNPSDRNLKTNITPITYGLQEVLKLNPVSYNWKDDTNTNKQFGFIAQEVQEILPDAVVEGEYLGLEKDAIYASLVNAIKELTARIEQLENK